MDPQWKTDVLPRLSTLVDVWAPNIDELYASNLVDNGERDLLLHLPRREQCASLLLKILPWKGVGTYERFHRVLQRTEKRKIPFGILESSTDPTTEAREEPIDPRWESFVESLLSDAVEVWRPHLGRLRACQLLSEQEYELLHALSHYERCRKLLIDILPRKVPRLLNQFLNVEGREPNLSIVINMLEKLEKDERSEPVDHARWLIREPFLSQLVASSWKLSKPTFILLREIGLISAKEYKRFISFVRFVEELEKREISEKYLYATSPAYGRRKLITQLLNQMGGGDCFTVFLHVMSDRGRLPANVRAILDSAMFKTAFYVLHRRKAVAAAPDAEASLSQCKDPDASLFLQYRGMLLKFVKRRTVEDAVGASGSKLKCDSFSLTVPPDAVVGKAVRISFTLYEYQPEASEGVDESHVITDLVVLHPCGQHFAKEVDMSFNMEHVSLSEEVNAFLLYEERRAGSFIPSPVRASRSSVYGDMTAVLHRSSLDVTTNHFCKFFACLFGCVGHCYRTLAYGRWAKGEALRSQTTTAIDIFFTSYRPSHVDFVERCHRGMPVLLNGNATIYFPKRGRFTLDVAKVSDGWELVSPAAISVEKEELMQAKRHSSKFVTRSFVLKKSAEDAGELWLEILLTDDVKTNCIFSLKEYAAIHSSCSSASSVDEKCSSTISPSPQEIDLFRVPTGKELLDISQRILGQWKFVARYLDVEDTIDMISENARGDVKEQAYQMLSTWKERQCKDASVEDLCKSLVAVGLKSTAEKVFGYY